MSRRNVWTVVILVGGYVLLQAVADIGATRLVQIGSATMPAGTFVFALTFTWRDLLHRRLGREWARAAIVAAGALNIVQAGYLWAVAQLPAPAFYAHAEAWGAIFALVPAITLGSIAAEVVSELVDTEVYHALRRGPRWLAVLASNAVALPLDSLLFGTLAFTLLPLVFGGGSLALGDSLALVRGQIVWKAAVTVVSLPLIYAVRGRAAD
jgi:uncharacterized integral membrane protein (TIGR00697 family)